MVLLQIFEILAKNKKKKIGIGLGNSEFHNKKILNASYAFSKKYKSEILIFGEKSALVKLQDHSLEPPLGIQFKECINPEEQIVTHLINKKIYSIVRGSLSSNKFLESLKSSLKLQEINRLALLETINGHQFFYGPVGIDECNSFEKKKDYLNQAIKLMQTLDIKPIISVLSGGRISDLGRDQKVDETIKNADKIVIEIKKKYPDLKISHDEILIEKAIEKFSNLIIAPDGISGNLIYRTLVHLGGGKAYGAIYMGINKTIIDTSRVGDFSEIYGALILALALS